MAKYKWETCYDWLVEKAKTWDKSELYSEFIAVAGMIDQDQIQDRYQAEMDSDGFFEELIQDKTMQTKLSLREFIKLHRHELDQCIAHAIRQTNPKLNDSERRDWIMNDEGLYNWARSEGVRI